MTTTEKVRKLLTIYTKLEFSEELGISRPTLDSRLIEKSKWKKLEISRINYLYNKNYE